MCVKDRDDDDEKTVMDDLRAAAMKRMRENSLQKWKMSPSQGWLLKARNRNNMVANQRAEAIARGMREMKKVGLDANLYHLAIRIVTDTLHILLASSHLPQQQQHD